MTACRRIQTRAFTLIEAVTVVLVLALAVPPAVVWLDEAVSARADSVNATRATAYAGAVMEHILADCSSDAPGLGFNALASGSAYLSTPATGLYARLAPVSGLYTPMEFTCAVSIGALVDSAGIVNADTSRNIFRTVTVDISFPSARGGRLSLSVSAMVSGGAE